MGLSHSPSIVTNSLLLNLDFKNPKRVSGGVGAGNLVQSPNYSSSAWTNYFPANNYLTTGIAAPDGSNTAVRITCSLAGSSLLRVFFNGFTPNGTDTYVISFWVRKVSGTTSTSSQLWCDLHDGTPSLNYAPNLVTGEWVRVSVTGVPAATYRGFLDLLSDNTNDYVLDFWGVKIENASASNSDYPIKDTVGGYVFNVYHPQFSALNYDNIQFTRTDSAATKWGGVALTTPTNSLSLGNFMYNDHTWEIWFRIDDVNPGVYTGNEAVSVLAVYPGYHQGFVYNASTVYYDTWDNTVVGAPVEGAGCSWSLGTTGTQVIQGTWCQLVAVKSGLTYIPYINGVAGGTGYTKTTMAFNSLYNSGTLNIGAAANVAAGAGNYVYYSKSTIANMKMYNRVLSAAEIKQNFNALRGRFGI